MIVGKERTDYHVWQGGRPMLLYHRLMLMSNGKIGLRFCGFSLGNLGIKKPTSNGKIEVGKSGFSFGKLVLR